MKTININTQEYCKLLLFPDNQTHVKVVGVANEETVNVVVSLTDSLKMMQLLQLSNALDHMFCEKQYLYIPYLLGARSDRVMTEGDSVDLEVTAQLINSLGFKKVFLYDAHSEASTLLIKNSINCTNKDLVKRYVTPNSILICPDGGAVKRLQKYLDWTFGSIVDVVYCNKKRDLSNGNITIVVLEPEKCTDKPIVIIDDLCDGGGTFLGILSQIKPSHSTLIVTHSIFSKGTSVLTDKFDQIITSDSYGHIWNDNKIIHLKNPLDGSVFSTG